MPAIPPSECGSRFGPSGMETGAIQRIAEFGARRDAGLGDPVTFGEPTTLSRQGTCSCHLSSGSDLGKRFYTSASQDAKRKLWYESE
jgi:hypothetical protein